MKTKGLSLTSRALETVSPETMKQLVEDRKKEVRVEQFQIARDMNKTRLFSRTTQKRLRYTSSKRALETTTLTSFPYGYVPKNDLDELLHGLDLAISQ